ncbi:Phage related hypothetical protein [Luteibacter sp. UNC138MFCol5.1]|uniref:DUF1799 domain-containing protein n=1 Tax=Luteibacter sp. UNC138MFCol5.1 TaxID=1502774 RepID=UPI0008BFB439|nr:DUF1799 domain-containing protein [Luteibacter sp. UNC138MFCol5.1]SEO63357.1 Phage related hypothetical protein [Luteibacter sp. UNC138MFCol5.1]
MRALYGERPTAAQASLIGLRASDFPKEQTLVELWPETFPQLLFFRGFTTQWRQGPGGPVGLDYAVIFHELDRKGLATDAYDDMLHALRIIEDEALKLIHTKKP